MKDIAIYKSIYMNEQAGVHLQQYVLNGKADDLYKIDLLDFGVLQYSKFVDGDLLTLQVCSKLMDELCEAWVSHRRNTQDKSSETQTETME